METPNAEPAEAEPTEPPPTVSYGPGEAEQRAADLIHAYRTLGQPPAEDGARETEQEALELLERAMVYGHDLDFRVPEEDRADVGRRMAELLAERDAATLAALAQQADGDFAKKVRLLLDLGLSSGQMGERESPRAAKASWDAMAKALEVQREILAHVAAQAARHREAVTDALQSTIDMHWGMLEGSRKIAAERLAEVARLRADHCKDCCCARSWEALGVTEYDGKDIPEHIRGLRARVAELEKCQHRCTNSDGKCIQCGVYRQTGVAP